MAGIQEALSKYGLLAVIDDLEYRKKVFVNLYIFNISHFFKLKISTGGAAHFGLI